MTRHRENEVTKAEALAVLTSGADTIAAKLETLMVRFCEGAYSTESVYHEAAVAYQRHMADEVWDAFNGVAA